MKTEINKNLFFLPHNKQQLIEELSGIILSSSVDISETVKYGRLTFVAGKKLIAFICSKNDADYIELGFFKAVFLNDPKELFKGKGKEIRRIKIKSTDEIPVSQIKKWVRDANSMETKV